LDRLAQAQAAEPRFDILEFVVDGNTVLDIETIERAVYAFLGPDQSMQAVEGARSALEAQFQKRGFLTVSVDIPEQKVDRGEVHLRVIEGRVGRLRVTGSRYFDLGYIKSRVASLAPGSVPPFPTVQAELGALNRSPDRRVSPLLRPGSLPGTVDVDLAVQDQLPLHGSVEVNDRYNAFTAPLRITSAVRFDNLWQAGHSVGLSWTVAPQHARDSDVLSLTYSLPTVDEQTLTLYGVHSSSNVVPAAFDTIGKGNITGMRYVLPLPGSKGLFHSVTLGFDHKQFGETVRLAGQDATNTPITYSPLLLQYGGFEQDEAGALQFLLAANLGLANTFGNKDADFQNKRFGASASFLTLRADLSRTATMSGGWSLFARLSGQFSPDPLISNEQLALGGADTVRGYYEAEVLGDDGYAATIELRSSHLGSALKDRFPGMYLFVFWDHGVLKDKQVLAGQTANFGLASEGVGLKIDGRAGLHLGLDVAHVLRHGSNTREGSSRLEFRLGQEF
jgi:hemolysin activation/secretion protein